jgi:hypothetical protein
MSAGPYVVIASHIAATEAYGYETQIVYMSAKKGDCRGRWCQGLFRDRARCHRR